MTIETIPVLVYNYIPLHMYIYVCIQLKGIRSRHDPDGIEKEVDNIMWSGVSSIV